MGLKLKVCADCGVRKMIGRTKSRCKACRVADPTKFENRPRRSASKRGRRKPLQQTTGPFVDRPTRNLPSCPNLTNTKHNTTNLRPEQRDAVLKACGYSSYAVYLQSALWFSIRAKILPAACACGCGRIADQVHHTQYTEANLMGASLGHLVPINHYCHRVIEFIGKRKARLTEANAALKQRQNQHRG